MTARRAGQHVDRIDSDVSQDPLDGRHIRACEHDAVWRRLYADRGKTRSSLVERCHSRRVGRLAGEDGSEDAVHVLPESANSVEIYLLEWPADAEPDTCTPGPQLLKAGQPLHRSAVAAANGGEEV